MSNAEETKTTKYMVCFTYTIVVDAEDGDTAEDLAYADFEEQLGNNGGLVAGDFAMSDAEDVTNWYTD